MVNWSKQRTDDEKRYETLRNIPSEILTKDVAISICEDIINHFNIPQIRETYFWKEKEGKNITYYNQFGWYILIGSLLYETGFQDKGVLKHFHPYAWAIIQSKLPQLSEL